MLEELGVEYEFIKVEIMKGAGQSAEYLKIHADGKVPAIDDEGFVLTESAAIVTYLGDKYPALNLVPEAKTKQRAKYDEWCFFVLSELEQPLWTIGKHTFVFPETKRVPEVLEVARWEFLKACKVLENKLAVNEYAMGNKFSAIDILVVHTLRWAKGFGVESGSSRLDRYREEVGARPALVKAINRESVGS
jgi:glutathione S-transferase